jgi:plasmid replication initiation protein
MEQLDIFRAAYADIPIRDQRDTMERPFFSLSKSPRRTPIKYEVNGVLVKVSPVQEYGVATIWDADILIWAATQITECLDRGGKPSRTLHFHPHTLLKGIRRGVGGDQYRKLQDALRRLGATYIETSIRLPQGSRKATVDFHWIEKWDSLEEGASRRACR